ncbi:MAG: hypothetical protein Q8R39_01490 [bacterium]|nr:hypothetical protein [bacterium]MDZ4284943.1 hypothetical protein [Patescibacteria group bacterium]
MRERVQEKVVCETMLSYEAFGALTPERRLRYLACCASRAPSTHNTQPWAFVLRTRERNPALQFFLDRRFVLPASDPTGRQSVISIGAAVENALIAASYYGLTRAARLRNAALSEVKPALARSEQRYVPLAEILFDEPAHAGLRDARGAHALMRALFTRKMTRAEFLPEKHMPHALMKKILAMHESGVKIHLITDGVRRRAIAEFQAQADNFVLNSPRFSRELGHWLLHNDTDAGRGMPGIGFGLSDTQAIRIHDGLVGEGALRPDDMLRFALGGKAGIESSPLIGILTIKKNDVAHWLAAGRMLERILLELTSADIAVAVHAALVEVALVNKMFALTLGTLRPIAALFRAGYLRNPAHALRPRAPRVPLEELVLTHEPSP